jgi:ABC-type sugar transport system ATPase subunit
MATLELKQVRKNYGNLEVIHGIDLFINNGEFCVLVGPSGCGKSTLLRMIAGLEQITKGDILIDEQLVNNISAARRGLAMVFQSYALYPHMSVRQNLAFGLENLKMEVDEIDKRILEAARLLRMEEYLQRKPGQLSGGQKQRVAIGRAIVREPSIYLFDEPLSNLDAELRVATRVELKALHARLGNTMIYVTHDQVEAMTMADKIVVMNDGIIEQVGAPLELYNKPSNKFVAGFIGSPKMNFISTKILSKSGDKTEVDIMGSSKISIPKTSASASEGDSVELGIRPEHLTVNQSGDASWESKVFVVEKLGSGTFLYLEKEGEPLVVETDGDSNIKVGDTVKVGFDAERCHLFDSSKQAFK